MRKVFLAVGLALFVGACANSGPSVIEGLTLANNTIASASRATETALTQGQIDVQTACRVEVYGRLARAAIDGGFQSWATGNGSDAEQALTAARNILNGVSAEAVAQADREC